MSTAFALMVASRSTVKKETTDMASSKTENIATTFHLMLVRTALRGTGMLFRWGIDCAGV
jgi:hypothetical protein